MISLQSRDSQESSPAPQFKSINSLSLALLYDSILTSVRDYWKNHNFDYTDLCWQSDISARFGGTRNSNAVRWGNTLPFSLCLFFHKSPSSHTPQMPGPSQCPRPPLSPALWKITQFQMEPLDFQCSYGSIPREYFVAASVPKAPALLEIPECILPSHLSLFPTETKVLLFCCSPWGHKESDVAEHACMHSVMVNSISG